MVEYSTILWGSSSFDEGIVASGLQARQFYSMRIVSVNTFVTGPAKIGHVG